MKHDRLKIFIRYCSIVVLYIETKNKAAEDSRCVLFGLVSEQNNDEGKVEVLFTFDWQQVPNFETVTHSLTVVF